MLRFNLGTEMLEYSDDYAFYNAYWSGLSAIANRAYSEFKEEICSYSSISDLLRDVSTIADEKLDLAFSYCVDALMSHGIFDYDIERLKERAGEDADFEEDEAYQDLLHQYQSIQESEADLKQQREYERASRSRWQGGGFGIRGAVKGAVKAGAMNMVTDSFRGIGDSFTDAGDRKKFKKLRSSLLSEKNMNELGNALWRCIMNGIMNTLAEILEEETGKDPSGLLWEGESKAKATFNNISRILNSEQKLVALKTVLEANPYNWTYMKYLLENYSDYNIPCKEALAVAGYFQTFQCESWKCNKMAQLINAAAKDGNTEKIKASAIEFGYLNEDLRPLEQTYPGVENYPQKILVAMALVEGLAIKRKIDEEKENSYEILSAYENQFMDICKKYGLLNCALDDWGDIVNACAESGYVAELKEVKEYLVTQKEQAFIRETTVNGIRFETLEQARTYKEELVRYEKIYPPVYSYVDFESSKLKAAIVQLKKENFISKELQDDIGYLEEKLERLKVRECSPEYKRSKAFIEEFSKFSDNVLIYGSEDFLKCVTGFIKDPAFLQYESNMIPSVIYNESSINNVRGFILSDQFLYYVSSGLFGRKVVAIKLDKIWKVTCNESKKTILVNGVNGDTKIKMEAVELIEPVAEILNRYLEDNAKKAMDSKTETETEEQENSRVTDENKATTSTSVEVPKQLNNEPQKVQATTAASSLEKLALILSGITIIGYFIMNGISLLLVIPALIITNKALKNGMEKENLGRLALIGDGIVLLLHIVGFIF